MKNIYEKINSSNSFLVVGRDGKLHRIQVPFKVRVFQSLGELKFRQILEVGKIRTSNELRIIYVINNQSYNPALFEFL